MAPDNWAKSNIILIKKDLEALDNNPSTFRMISLTLNIGKLFHTLEAERCLSFMLQNKYLDPSAQKAYVNGINGCVEHVTVVSEAIQHAKLNHKTLHASWMDLKDAFGSVPHALIPYVMSYYHMPKTIIAYITNLYSKLEGKVSTKNWESNTFRFLRGVFQGDPLSGIIFLIVFNPLIEYLKQHKESHGYQITKKEKGVKNVVTTPFADDFNIITREKTMHQKLIGDIEEKLRLMGFILKPEKCRSLSINKGKAENIEFNLSNETTGKVIKIESVLNKPMKFLGSTIGSISTPNAIFAEILSKLTTKLENIERSTLRGEFKLNIYTRYALPSMRYFFSVHQMNETNMTQLDSLVRKHIKQWLGVQKHGVSDAAIFHPYMLSIKMPSQLYKEAHAGNYALIRSKGDELVNHAMDSRLERESAWSKKHSTVASMHQMWQENLNKKKIQDPLDQPYANPANIKHAKKAMLTSVQNQTMNYWNERIKGSQFKEILYNC